MPDPIAMGHPDTTRAMEAFRETLHGGSD